MPLISATLTEAQALLNDTAKVIFTDAALLPFVKKAYQELQDELSLNGVGDIFEEDTTINVAANATSIPAGGGAGQYPTDLIMPLTLWEKNQGAEDSQYTIMFDRNWEPSEQKTDMLRLWRWQEGEIELVGSTSAKTVKMRYIKFLTAIVDGTTNVPLLNCQTFLSARSAAIAAVVIGGNPEKGQVLQADADVRLTKLIQIAVKRMQSNPTRRLPYRAHS